MENKEIDKIIIKPDIARMVVLEICVFMSFLIMLILQIQDPLGFPESLIFILFYIFCFFSMVYNFILFAKTIILTSEGYTIKLWFVQKTYPWDQVKTRLLEKIKIVSSYGMDGYRLYTEALFLSTYKVRKHSFIPSMIYKDFSPHPFATVCIYLQHSGEDSKHVGNGKEVSGGYETDGPRLKEALKKWNVEIEIRIIVD